MSIILRTIAPWLIALLAISGLLFAAKEYGYQQGVAATQAQQLADAQQAITSLNASATAANAANLKLGKTLAQFETTGNETTRSIRNALKKTADQRINCVLPDSVLRDLDAARQRANKAAASGIDDTVPAAPGPSG